MSACVAVTCLPQLPHTAIVVSSVFPLILPLPTYYLGTGLRYHIIPNK